MGATQQFIQGEHNQKLDERFRLSLPKEYAEVFKPEGGLCVIAKERPGCLSLWEEKNWTSKLDARVELIRQKMLIGDFEKRTPELQRFGRLLSTRHRSIKLEGKNRLVLPEGFREFLAVEPGSEVMVVGAGVCIEIWHPVKWISYQEEEIQEFQNLLNTLS